MFLRDLEGCCNLLYFLIIIASSIRDFIYDIIARKRYSVFGKPESGMVPISEIWDRFL